MAKPTRDLPIWATDAAYPEILDGNGNPTAWSEESPREPTGMAAVAAQGHVPDEPTDAESFNDWLGLLSEYVAWLTDEVGAGIRGRVGLTTDRLIAGTETLNNDLYVDELTVPVGTTLITDGWRIFARRIVCAGTIHNNGEDGGLPAQSNPYDGGAGGGANYLNGGGDGAEGAHTGSNEAGAAATGHTGRIGGTGGAGGGNGAGEAGGTATSGTVFALAAGEWRRFPTAVEQRSWLADGTYAPMRGGIGGSSGANDSAGGGQGGGGGGGGGGIVVIVCDELELDGTIEADGGDGGDGFVTVSTGAGGGGGGGGGAAVVAYRSRTGSGSITAAGGLGGAGAGTGVAGSAGSAGSVVELVM